MVKKNSSKRHDTQYYWKINYFAEIMKDLLEIESTSEIKQVDNCNFDFDPTSKEEVSELKESGKELQIKKTFGWKLS